jgi:hypothetical protein
MPRRKRRAIASANNWKTMLERKAESQKILSYEGNSEIIDDGDSEIDDEDTDLVVCEVSDDEEEIVLSGDCNFSIEFQLNALDSSKIIDLDIKTHIKWREHGLNYAKSGDGRKQFKCIFKTLLLTLDL